MTYWIVVAIIAYYAVKHPAFMKFLKIVGFIVSVVGLLILLKIGFIGVFLEELVMIPINLFMGIFGIAYSLLFT
jgi:hypothetical protein